MTLVGPAERIDPLRFLAGCRTGDERRLNQALSALSLSLSLLAQVIFECVLCCLLGPLMCCVSLRLYLFCLLVVLVRLSVQCTSALGRI